jgi:hypothetical protein
MRRHWRWIVWVLMWPIALSMMPNVTPLYWLLLVTFAGWAFHVRLILEPRWSIDDELDEIRSWST